MTTYQKQSAKTPTAKTKKARIVALLKRNSGATIAQIAKTTGWQAHTIRAAITRLRQQGIEIQRNSKDGLSRYRIVAMSKAT